MSKFHNVKNFKNMVSSLDINKLYKLQEYVTESQSFFKELEFCILEYSSSDSEDCGCEICFTEKIISLYYSMIDKLKVK